MRAPLRRCKGGVRGTHDEAKGSVPRLDVLGCECESCVSQGAREREEEERGRTAVSGLVVDNEGGAGGDGDGRRVLEHLVDLEALLLVRGGRGLRLEEEDACEREGMRSAREARRLDRVTGRGCLPSRKPRTASVWRLGWYEKRPAIVEGELVCAAEVG